MAPSAAPILLTLFVVTALAAGVLTAVKGQWIWLVVGVLTSGLAFFYGAPRRAKPGSLWAGWAARRPFMGCESVVVGG